MNKIDLIAQRDVKPEDFNFIFATWLRGLRYGNSWFEAIDTKVYFTIYHKIIEKVLLKPTTSIKIACLKDDIDVVLGYSIYEGTRLDWVFVKKAWRGIGIAKSLIPGDTQVVSHLTNTGLLMLKKHPNVAFNPFSL